ncbi:hypothetical protein ABEF95_006519 [Exophiala dermatitidis]
MVSNQYLFIVFLSLLITWVSTGHASPLSDPLSTPLPSKSISLSAPTALGAGAPSSTPTAPPDPDRNKYFHEPGGDDLLHHYDARFFQRIVSDEERRDTLQHLIRAYFLTFDYLGIETWIAHGTLLAWYWNGKILPWDWDLDTQVTDEGLRLLGKHYNQTYYDYEVGDGQPKRRYYLDVNSWSWQRDRGDGANIIDARFISVDNGLFVDITGLSEVYPETEPGIIICKNNHRYRLRDIFPLRHTYFEGVKAKVPSSYVPILTEEYSDAALVRTEFQGHQWDMHTREWIKLPDEQEIPQGEDGSQPDSSSKEDGAYA